MTPVSGHEPGDAADDDEGLDAEEGGEAGGQQLLERRVGPQGDAQAGADHQQEGDEDGGGAEQAELLADGGEDEVGLDRGDAVGVAEAEPGAGDAAPRRGRTAACTTWKPSPPASGHGSSQIVDPVLHVGERLPGDARRRRRTARAPSTR